MVGSAPTVHRFTVEDWDRLVELGFFTKDDRVELLDGEIIDMAPIGDPHNASVARLLRLFAERAHDAGLLWVQSSVRTADDSVPQPDVVLLELRDDFYASRKPTPAQALLVVEVSESSLSYDRNRKARHYARTGVRECWIANLVDGVVEVFTDPSADGYRTHQVRERGATLTPTLVPSVTVRVEDVIGPA
jgi:Uma2 family endonuclease